MTTFRSLIVPPDKVLTINPYVPSEELASYEMLSPMFTVIV